MQTKNIGRLFVHKIYLIDDSPRFHTWTTYEVDAPYRESKSLVVHLGRSLGLVFGWWRTTHRSEYDALKLALDLQETDLYDADGDLLENFQDDSVHPLDDPAKGEWHVVTR